MDFGLCGNLSLFPKHPVFISVLAIFGFQYFLGSNLKVTEVAQKKKKRNHTSHCFSMENTLGFFLVGI